MKKLHTFYITKNLNVLTKYLVQREEVTKIVFLRRAIRYFLAGDQKIDPRIEISKRTDPEYIKRDVLFPVYLDSKEKEILENLAEEKHCRESQVFFQILLDYCSFLISLDDGGIYFNKEYGEKRGGRYHE